MKHKLKFLVVSSNFYPDITKRLLDEAILIFKTHNINYVHYTINGSLEIPTKITIELEKKKYDAALAIGCIVKGKTDHYDFICKSVTHALLALSIDKKIPITNSILMCMNKDQAIKRSSKKVNRAREAVLAALSVINK